MDTVQAIEIWRPVEGYPYEVSNLGRVRRAAPEKNTWVGRILVPSFAGKGYARVNLCGNGRRRQWRVSVLVCTAFHGPKPAPDVEVRHWDGNSRNDRADNLLWGTAAENSADRERHGRTPKGEQHSASRLTTDAVRRIRAEYVEVRVGRSNVPPGWRVAIAERYGISVVTVSDITTKKKTWREC